MKQHIVGRHEALGMHQSYKDFDNQKQLDVGRDVDEIAHLSGDVSMDDRIDDADMESNLEWRQKYQQYSLGLFIHPMHDATLDTQLNADHFREINSND